MVVFFVCIRHQSIGQLTNSTFVSQQDLPKKDFEKVTLNVCTLVETGNPGFMIDYNRIAAAIDVAVIHANENILAKALKIVKIYKDAGSICDVESLAVSRILEWVGEGITCNIYIGPGQTFPNPNNRLQILKVFKEYKRLFEFQDAVILCLTSIKRQNIKRSPSLVVQGVMQ